MPQSVALTSLNFLHCTVWSQVTEKWSKKNDPVGPILNNGAARTLLADYKINVVWPD